MANQVFVEAWHLRPKEYPLFRLTHLAFLRGERLASTAVRRDPELKHLAESRLYVEVNPWQERTLFSSGMTATRSYSGPEVRLREVSPDR
jgi:hypothetical protein